MGVLSHSKLYSNKFINAEIMDSSKRIWVVHVKHTLGDYFLADIDKKTYAFRLTGEIYTYHHLGMRTVRKMYFSTKHYRPISFENNKELELFLKENSLPAVDRTLFATLKYLGKREKYERNPETNQKIFVPHDLKALADEVAEKENVYADQVRNLITYIEHLNIDQIVTPVKHITEFMESDFIATDPKFLGDILLTADEMDEEHKRVTNVPVKGKKPWLLIALLGIICATVIGVIAIGATSGWFDSLGSGFGGLVPQPNKPTQASLVQQYPTPESMKIAIDNGQLDYKTLPAEMKKLIDNFKPQPIVKPKSQTVELTP